MKVKKHFFSWRDDRTGLLIFQITPTLRDALRQIRPHAVHLYVDAETELPEWAVGQINSTLYTLGNRILLRLATGRGLSEQLTYQEAEFLLRLLALAALKWPARSQAKSAFISAFEAFAQITPVAVRRKPLPRAETSDLEVAQTYAECSGTGTAYIEVASIFGLTEAVLSRDLVVPAAGYEFVAELDREFLLFTVVLHLLRNP